MAARKPSRPKTSRNGRLRAGSGLRNNNIGEKSGSVAERLRTPRRSSKAAGSEAAQEPPGAAIADAQPAAAEEDLESTTASSRPVKQTRRATGGRGAAADREKPHEAPAPDATSEESPAPAAGAAKRQRKGARAAAPTAPEAASATGPSSPRMRKGAEPRTAAAVPTTPTTPAAAPAEISPELGLGLAQALSAELAGLSQRLLESSTASAQQLASARSVPELIEIQARQLKALSEAWLEHTSRMSEIYLAALRPNERR